MAAHVGRVPVVAVGSFEGLDRRVAAQAHERVDHRTRHALRQSSNSVKPGPPGPTNEWLPCCHVAKERKDVADTCATADDCWNTWIL